MEKLTKENIERVEQFLDRNKLKYIDVRVEVLDHIISDIENNYLAKDIDFEEAFPLVAHKWKQHFTETSSLVFGLAYSAPKMVIKKAKNIYKKFWVTSIALVIISYLVFSNLTVFIPVNQVEKLNLVFQIAVITITILFALLVLKYLFSKDKTVYSFILKTQSFNFITGILIYNLKIIKPNAEVFLPSIMLFSIYLYFFFVYSYFTKKHIKTIEKYKLSS